MKSLQNTSSSVRQRLLNRSRADNRVFNDYIKKHFFAQCCSISLKTLQIRLYSTICLDTLAFLAS